MDPHGWLMSSTALIYMAAVVSIVIRHSYRIEENQNHWNQPNETMPTSSF